MQAFELSTDNGPAPFLSAEHCIHGFQKEFHILIHLTIQQFFFIFVSVFGLCSHVASLHGTALTCIGFACSYCSAT